MHKIAYAVSQFLLKLTLIARDWLNHPALLHPGRWCSYAQGVKLNHHLGNKHIKRWHMVSSQAFQEMMKSLLLMLSSLLGTPLCMHAC